MTNSVTTEVVLLDGVYLWLLKFFRLNRLPDEGDETTGIKSNRFTERLDSNGVRISTCLGGEI